LGFFGGGSIDAQAQAHYNRVIADGGVVPAGVSGTNAFFNAVKSIYGTSDITSAISVGVDAHYLGYKMGAGAGSTLGQAVQKLYSCAGSSGDVVQTTAASQPLLLAHNGASSGNYWYSPRVTGNYISSPYNSAISLRSNFDIKAEIKTSTDSLQQDIFGNANTSVQKLILRLNSANGLRLLLSLDGVTFLIYDSTASISNISDRQWVRVTRDSGTGIMKFFTSSDNVSYTQLGADVSGATGNLFNGTSVYEIGSSLVGSTANSFQGNIYRVLISQTIGGSAVLDFNPATYNASTSQTQWTSTTGEVWTINTGTAATGYKGVLVDRTIVQSDGVDDTMVQSTANRGDICTQYAAVKYAAVTTSGASFIDSQSHASYNAISWLNSTTIRTYFENATVIDRTIVAQTLNLITITNTNAAQTGSINNGTNGTNTQNPSTSKTGVTLFGNGAAGAKQQGFLNTYLCSNSINNSTVRTAIYNYIRSLNNNAF
jgi:hypothetical protein